MARLIRTEKEVEGRYEEVWLVVDEDALEQWPAGPREIVGRDAPRKTGPMRARGEARYTADIRLPGMLHAAVLRSPHAHARVAKIMFDEALSAPGVPSGARPRRRRSPERGGRVPGSGRGRDRGRYAPAGASRTRAGRSRVGPAEAAPRSGRGGASRTVRWPAEPLRAGRPRPGPRRGGRRRRSGVPDAGRPPQLHGDPPVHLRMARRLTRCLHLDAEHLWRPRRGRRRAGTATGQGARRLRVHGRRLRLEERGERPHVHRSRARQTNGSAGALRAHPPRREPRQRQQKPDDPASDSSGEVRRDARRARRRVRERNRVVRLGLVDRRPDADALRLRERPYRPLPGAGSIRRR